MVLRLEPGNPNQLGATPGEGGVNFALFSAHGVRVELVLFSRDGSQEIARADLPARKGDIWHGFAPRLGAGTVYGYRVHGPYRPDQGHLFNPYKVLLDPYARAVAGKFQWGPEHFGYFYEGHDPDGMPDNRDNAATCLKGVVVDPAAMVPLPRHNAQPWGETLIYELHARGFTMQLPGLSDKERGTFAGLGSQVALDYLCALGITTIELLPIHQFIHDRFLVDQGLKNYWGYNTLNYFAPHQDYALGDPIKEMRGFVHAAHARNLDVWVDVVYNHTCEGNRHGPTLSYRGIDNASYYRLNPQDLSRYADISGCGATLNAAHPRVRDLIVESLAHWVQCYGVDGFRFDIAPSLGMDGTGRFSQEAPFFDAVRQDPRLKDIKMIAEAWDAAGGYYVGDFPPDWAAWNGQARDSIRQFWRGDLDLARDFAKALAGSPDVFRNKGKPVEASINFVACHDGFPLLDLTRYARKHNHANGENNRDGGDHDFSANYGVEGETTDREIEELRERQARNMLASVFLSFGTPMVLAGDEMGRTQGGNNNAYAQDNAISWLDWRLPGSRLGARRLTFTKQLIALRKEMFRGFPAGHPNGPGEREPTIAWWSVWGNLMTHQDWMDETTRCFAAVYEPRGWLILFNASLEDAAFILPPAGIAIWRMALTTADPIRPTQDQVAAGGQTIHLPARTLIVFSRDSSRTIGKTGHGF
jgi:isoamylase